MESNLGVGLAFLKVKIWIWVSGVAAFLSLYLVIRNVRGSECLIQSDASNKAVLSKNQYYSKFGLKICPRDLVTIHSFANHGFFPDNLEVVYYLLIFLLFSIGARITTYFEHKNHQEFLDKHHQASDWTLQITPKVRLDEQGLKQMIESNPGYNGTKVEVIKIIFPIDVSEIEETQTDIKDLTLKIIFKI